MALLGKLKAALVGKKTYIAAGVVVVLGLIAILDSNPANDFIGMSLVVMGLGLAGLGAKADRHHAEMLAHVAQVVVDAIAKKPITVEQAQAAIADGQELFADFKAGAQTLPPFDPLIERTAGGESK